MSTAMQSGQGDLADKLIKLKRKNHPPLRTRERAERPVPVGARSPPSPTSPRKPPPGPQHQPTPTINHPEADPEDFSRRLRISSSPRPSHAHPNIKPASKLFNPDTDPIPMRRTQEPEAISDSPGSSYARPVPKQSPQPKPAAREPPSQQRQLYDYRRDDPVRFAVQARKPPTPVPKTSGDYVSVSSVSSYAHSITSSSFTLNSSTTDGSSAPSSLFDRKHRDESRTNNAFSAQLKKLYRDISALETKILHEDADDSQEDSRMVLRPGPELSSEEAEKTRWKKMIEDHKQLAEMMHTLLVISLAPSVPASLRNIPEKYNIIIRLWSHAFHRLLENLRRSSFTSKVALEHLQDFIYYAYIFYTGLLEERNLKDYRSGWLEALGDLARYRMAVAAMVNPPPAASATLTASNMLTADRSSSPSSRAMSELSEKPAARIDDSPSPSVGIVAARLFELEPEKVRWRNIAREWYFEGITDTPGNGKLQHHLGLLSREADGEDLRGIYHFAKSMIATHPFQTSRESVLPMWSQAAQARRASPDASATDLFVLLHGMLFTNIQLDDFEPTLARLLERLAHEDPEGREWTMMACVNIASLLEYGKPQGILRRSGAAGNPTPSGPSAAAAAKVKLAKKAEEKMDVDGADETQRSPAMEEPEVPEQPSAAFQLAAQLTFTILDQVLDHPERRVTPYSPAIMNPYLTVLLTFLATVLRHPVGLASLERSIPWAKLAKFLSHSPRHAVKRAAANPSETLAQSADLPEDWCIRGMAWGGRRLYERGFWKRGEESKMEMEVLDEIEAYGVGKGDGMIEDDDESENDAGGKQQRRTYSTNEKRWQRVAWAGARLSRVVDGFRWTEGRADWSVEGALDGKVAMWEEERRLAREEEERRKRGRRWADDSDMMDVDEEMDEDDDEESEDDEDDSEEVKALKARRRHLRALLQASRQPVASSSSGSISRKSQPRTPRKSATRPALRMLPGYTTLVVDTNILLSSRAEISRLITSHKWTVVIPLPVVMELDGHANNDTPLGEEAKFALNFLVSHIRSHPTSLKVQTSKGNYLSSLSIRSEQVDFDDPDAWERNMDDLILKAAIWQDEHWSDRSGFLKIEDKDRRDTKGTSKVVLLSLDRMLRLKARSRQLDAADEKDIAVLFSTASAP